MLAAAALALDQAASFLIIMLLKSRMEKKESIEKKTTFQ
jgi:hypothetical protein